MIAAEILSIEILGIGSIDVDGVSADVSVEFISVEVVYIPVRVVSAVEAVGMQSAEALAAMPCCISDKRVVVESDRTAGPITSPVRCHWDPIRRSPCPPGAPLRPRKTGRW